MSELPQNITSWITLSQAAELLRLSEAKVRRLIEEKSLIAVKDGGQLLIPADVIVDGQILSSLRGTLFVLADAGYSSAESLEWLYAENSELDTSPITALLEGRKSAVRRATQSLG